MNKLQAEKKYENKFINHGLIFCNIEVEKIVSSDVFGAVHNLERNLTRN